MNNSRLAAAAALAALAALAAVKGHAAGHDDTAPRTAALKWLSGGIGKDDVAHMRSLARRYSLEMEFSARRDNEFVADATIRIEDAHGHVVFRDTDAGPIVLVDLEPGSYEVRATAEGHSELRTVQVPSHGTARLYFHWNEERSGGS